MPIGVGQSLTTILTTVTTPVATVGTVSWTIGTTQVVSSVLHTEGLTTSFSMKGTGGSYGCIYQQVPFTASQGEAIAVNLQSDAPVSIYIMTASDYQAWVNSKSCPATNTILYNKDQVSSDYVDMIAPSTGNYYLVLLNFSPSRSANVNVGVLGSARVATTMNVPVLTQAPTTSTNTVVSTLTLVQPVSDTLQQYGLFALPVILVLAVGLLAFQRRSSKRKVEATRAVVPVTGRFCGDCGNAIPIDAKFCPKCGANTEDA